MKKLLPLLLLVFTGMVNAQTVAIPDPVLKAKLVASSATDAPNKIAKDFSDNWMAIDANGDGEIQQSEAQAVKLLTLFDAGITNVTGLNSFSHLQTFSISNSPISSLNLNPLTDLRSFSCFGMPGLSTLSMNSLTNLSELMIYNSNNLISLDASPLTNLTKLTCAYSNLTTINVNGLSHLTFLYIPGNRLTNLNGLSNSITAMDCSQNQLTSLNLTGLTNLTQLFCDYNQLVSLNTPINLAKLDCSNNKLTSLNLAAFTNLSELNCDSNEIPSLDVSGLHSLTKLSCNDNKFTAFNLSGLPNLTSLKCGHNDSLTSVMLANLPALNELEVIGNTTSNAETLSHLSSLSLTNLPNLQKLNCNYGLLTSLDLNGLTALTDLECANNLLTSLTLTNLPNLQNIYCGTNKLTSLDASGLPNLETLYCGGSYIIDGQVQPTLTSINVTGLANLKKFDCGGNRLSALDLTGLVSLEELGCDGAPDIGGNITSLNVNGLTNLKTITCARQMLTSLNVSNLVNLTNLYCAYNQITSLDLTGLINLQSLDYTYNQLADLNLVNLPSLTYLACAHNQLNTLNVLNLTSLTTLDCSVNNLTALNLSGLSSLVSLNFSYNQLAISNISGLSANLKSLFCDYNSLTDLNVSNLPNLEKLSCANNQLASLDVSSLNNLNFLDISTNQLTSIDVSNLAHLETLDVSQNQLTALNLAGLTTLKQLAYTDNVIPNLDVSFLTNLESLQNDSTQSTVLDVHDLTKLSYLSCSNNQLTTLDLNSSDKLRNLVCANNQLTTLDVSRATTLFTLLCDNNLLTTLFLKNGANEANLSFNNNPGLQYICADNNQIQTIQTQLNSLGMNATVCNSYCSFTPGGNHNTITGIAIFDADNNGCDATDVVNPFVRLNINDTAVNGATVTNINGTYNFFTGAGLYTIAPNTENPTWFDFSPTSADFTFADENNNVSTQNFCITAVGTHKDLEVVLSQLEPARPGFDARYKIVFKNKGNQMQSGAVTLQFDDARTDFLSATPSVDATGTNSLSWNFTNLMPFENRSITFALNLNTPTESPALNNGDVLNFIASVTPIAGDDFPSDNQFNYNQLVVGSFDPNEIVCLEGESVSPAAIGDYLHYMVNFENTGTYYAENVVVRLEIDSDKFDMNSLQLLNSSNPSSTRISANTVEFVLQGINLAAASGNPPVGGHGDVLFKIRTKDNLVTNDTVLQRAGIYFDYNFPVITNDAETTFAALSNPIHELDNSIKIYPNPAHSVISIDSAFTIQTVALYDVQGRILETHIEDGMNAKLDISTKSNGIYFLKIDTEKGSKVEKIIKQ